MSKRKPGGNKLRRFVYRLSKFDKPLIQLEADNARPDWWLSPDKYTDMHDKIIPRVVNLVANNWEVLSLDKQSCDLTIEYALKTQTALTVVKMIQESPDWSPNEVTSSSTGFVEVFIPYGIRLCGKALVQGDFGYCSDYGYKPCYPNPCGANQDCVESEDSYDYTCKCKKDFVPYEPDIVGRCIPYEQAYRLDPCKYSVCYGAHRVCVKSDSHQDQNRGYHCRCKDTYKEDYSGKCQKDDHCINYPCADDEGVHVPNQVCVPTRTSYTCSCLENHGPHPKKGGPFAGCSRKDPCIPNPCAKGETCQGEDFGDHRCDCVLPRSRDINGYCRHWPTRDTMCVPTGKKCTTDSDMLDKYDFLHCCGGGRCRCHGIFYGANCMCHVAVG